MAMSVDEQRLHYAEFAILYQQQQIEWLKAVR
jgi:hypothetical protein